MQLLLLPFAIVLAALAGHAAQRDVQRPVAEITIPRSRIDELVLARLKSLGIEPASPSSDAVFLRRVYLDVIGTLPTAAEVRAFLADRDPTKRAKLIDHLLGRDEFADYWAMKWSDLLRVKSEFPINLWPNAVQAYHHWIRTSVRDNLPYDQFVRELLTRSGSNFRVPQVNFYRAVQSRQPRALASAVALTFMGARAEKWPEEQLSQMATFFSAVGYKSTQEWKEEIVFFDSGKLFDPGTLPVAESEAVLSREAILPDGTVIRLSPDTDPREIFADWLITSRNPWFKRAIANRVWSWLLGRGIVHEPDDIRPDNPPVNPDLLAHLEAELVASGYDIKHLFRIILNSATYQLSSVSAAADHPGAAANFSHYLQRPLDAEVLVDAINTITGSGEQFASAIPEPFTFIPSGHRAIALADGSITSAILETLGRPKRDLGLESERSSRPTPAARLALLNSTQIQRKLELSDNLRVLIQANTTMPQLVTNLYLTILSRRPGQAELQAALAYSQTANANRRATALDVAWALMNSPEFLYRH